MNILFTSAGRRNYLLRFFKEALGGKGLVHAANSAPICTAFLEADKSVVTPLIYDKNYVGFLLEYCKESQIRAIIPLLDIDLPVLAAGAKRFQDLGITLVASSVEVARTCNDKWETFGFLSGNRFNTPLTFNTLSAAVKAIAEGALSFPVMVKPRWGMASIGIYVAEDMNELYVLHAKTKRNIERSCLRYESAGSEDDAVLIQEVLSGQEYGLDVINDLNGAYITTFSKKKVAMRAGETDAAVTVKDAMLSDLGKTISRLLGHRANLDVDIIVSDRKPYVLEMNARFGGGYPFSHLAGANLPKAIVSWIEGKPADPECFALREGVTAVKVIEPHVHR